MYEPEEVAAIPSTSMTSSAESVWSVWQFNATNFLALSALLTLKFENEKTQNNKKQRKPFYPIEFTCSIYAAYQLQQILRITEKVYRAEV